MNKEVLELWPELEWIQDQELRDKVALTWEKALDRSELDSDDLNRIPFTLLCGPNLKVTFMEHKRSVVQISKEAGQKMKAIYHGELKVNMDVLIAGAILADVGKMLEYELDEEDNPIQGNYGKYLRHPFSGVSLAEECGVPPEVCHIIAAHAGEGDKIKRTIEAYIVHYVDFMTYLPFKERLEL